MVVNWLSLMTGLGVGVGAGVACVCSFRTSVDRGVEDSVGRREGGGGNALWPVVMPCPCPCPWPGDRWAADAWGSSKLAIEGDR